MRILSSIFRIAFGSDHKESLSEIDLIKPCKIEISSVHDIEGSGFGNNVIEDVDVVYLSGDYG